MLEAMPKVSIAAINGYALGGGFELALAADLRYLADDAKVGQPEIRLGVIPGAGGTQRLTHLVGPGRARDLVYTGRQVIADEALAMGWWSACRPAGRGLRRGRRRRPGVRPWSAPGPGAAKEAIRAASRPRVPAASPGERELFLALFGTPTSAKACVRSSRSASRGSAATALTPRSEVDPPGSAVPRARGRCETVTTPVILLRNEPSSPFVRRGR